MALEVDARGVPMSEWPKLLAHMVAMSVQQRRQGLPPLSAMKYIRYKREPARREIWQSAERTAQLGYGDCEDLAIYLTADSIVSGYPAVADTRFVRPGLRHALTRIDTRRGSLWIDPSAARGMRGKG